MTWIRVDTGFPENGKLGAFLNRITTRERRVSLPEAVGHVVLIWLWMGDHHWSGDLSKVPNENIEAAARWRGEAEVLALAFRDVFCTPSGKVKGWPERQGKLIEWRMKDNQRKRTSRGHAAGHPSGPA